MPVAISIRRTADRRSTDPRWLSLSFVAASDNSMVHDFPGGHLASFLNRSDKTRARRSSSAGQVPVVFQIIPFPAMEVCSVGAMEISLAPGFGQRRSFL